MCHSFHDGQAIGTLWIVAHSVGRHFDGEDRRLLTALAEFSSGIVQSYQKSREMEVTRQRLLDAECASRDFQQRLARAVSVAHVGFYEWTAQRDCVTYSPQMQQDWGIAAETTL